MRFVILICAVLLSGAFFLAQAGTDVAAQANAKSCNGEARDCSAIPDSPR